MADIVTSRQFTDGERGITAQKLNDIVGSSTIQPAFYTSKPTAPSADPADIALILKAGAYAQVPISSLAGSATQAQIWDTRLRSYNVIGNPNFEVGQRVSGYNNTPSGTFATDRWQFRKSGTMTVNTFAGGTSATVVPGTGFVISYASLSISLATAQASLAAGDYLQLTQIIEGSQLRELIGDNHSFSLLAQCSAPLKFSVVIKDNAGAWCLSKLCTIPTVNVPTLIQLPNLPVWTPSGTFGSTPGSVGCYITIGLCSGSTYMPSANDVWVNNGGIGAVGMDNFASKPVNTSLVIYFVQHEPGSVCTTLMDKPFSQNLDECLRYYCKSYPYTTKQGTASMAVGQIVMYASNASFPLGTVRFPKAMAKTPSVVVYDPTGGGSNSVRNFNMATAVAATAGDISDQGFDNVNTPSGVTVGQQILLHYTADTGY